MADVKISALPVATTPLAGTELVPIVQSGVTDQVTVANLTAGRTVAAATVNVDANSATNAVRITQTGAGNALLVEDSANPDSTPFVIDASGTIVSGNTTPISVASVNQRLQIHSIAADAAIQVGRWVDNAGAPQHIFVKSRGAVGVPTVVQNGDELFRIRTYGADGTGYIEAASIIATVDGVPGTNDMPGRLVFSTTADGASTPTERMRIDNAGQVGIGGTPSAGRTLEILKNMTGSTTSNGVRAAGVIQSDVTTQARYFTTSASTAAASFTLPSLIHYYAVQGTFGVGSTVTAQYGFVAENNLTGATNNYGFYSNIASGANRWNFYAAGTANNAYAGNSRFGGVTAPVATVDVTGSVAATTTIRSSGPTSGVGYATGAGGAVTQATSRTTGVTINNVCGAITLVSAAGSTSWTTFTVTNSVVTATDTIIINQRSGTDLYEIHITAVAAGSFNVSFRTTGGTTTEQPVFNFAIIDAVAA